MSIEKRRRRKKLCGPIVAAFFELKVKVPRYSELSETTSWVLEGCVCGDVVVGPFVVGGQGDWAKVKA